MGKKIYSWSQEVDFLAGFFGWDHQAAASARRNIEFPLFWESFRAGQLSQVEIPLLWRLSRLGQYTVAKPNLCNARWTLHALSSIGTATISKSKQETARPFIRHVPSANWHKICGDHASDRPFPEQEGGRQARPDVRPIGQQGRLRVST